MLGPEPFSPPTFSVEDARLWFHRAYVSRVVNGDTVVLFIDRGLQEYTTLKVRLAGVDAPETRPREGSSPGGRTAEKSLGERARARLAGLIEHREILVRTQKTAKHGKWLAQLYLPPLFEQTANQLLLDEGLAVPYGKPRPWRAEQTR